MEHIYDTIIIGGGPAGLSAGLYAARSRMDTLIIERAKFGGQATTTDELENYPGSIEDCTGTSLSKRMKSQAEEFGTQFVKDEVVEVELDGDIKVIKCKKETYKAKTIIIATGAYPRLGGFKNEIELRGKGVSYCATCDADFFTDLDIAVLGGGDSAITEAIYLAKFGETVTIIHRRDELRAAKSLQDSLLALPNVEVLWSHVPVEIKGEDAVKKFVIKDVKTGDIKELDTDAVFIAVGIHPDTELFKDIVKMDPAGYILADETCATSAPGIYAAGDCRKKQLRQVITAVADGANAATSAFNYISL